MKALARLLLSGFLAILAEESSWGKSVSIEWKPIKGAREYELVLEKNGVVFLKTQSPTPGWNGDLEAGVYTYRVRAVDRINRPGKWSATKPLAVAPPPVETLPLAAHGKITLYDSKAGPVLKWKEIPGIKKYSVEIKENGHTVRVIKITGTQVDVPSLRAGNYTWTVSAIMESKQKNAGALAGKTWNAPPSESNDLIVEYKKLVAPTVTSPMGIIPLPRESKVYLKWQSVPGAEAYQVSLTLRPTKKRTLAQLPKPKTFVVVDNEAVIDVEGEAAYGWEVRALANLDSKQAHQSSSPASTAEFEVNKAAAFSEGSGYVAVSGMVAPYNYKVVSPSGEGKAASNAMTLRLSGEYWFFPKWALALGAENTFFSIQNEVVSRKAFEAHAKYRFKFSDKRYGWYFYPKAGPEARQYFEKFPREVTSSSSTEFTVLGTSIGFDLRKQFTDSFSLGAKTAYFLPLFLAGLPGGGALSSAASYRNLSFGIQGLYWIGEKWGIGAGTFLETRSISYVPTGAPSSASEIIYTDATYFFGSVIFSFGK